MRQQPNFISAFAIRSFPALGLAALLLTGCAPNGTGSPTTTASRAATSTTPTNSVMPPTPAASSAPTSTPSTAPPYGAPSALANEMIDWEPCGQLECGTVTVPVDRNDESLGTLQIAVNVHRATNPDERIGYLLVNPGGPGGSGIIFAENAVDIFGEEVTNRFDVVGFDPRGVGQSEPTFECGNGDEQLNLLKDLTLPLDTSEIAAGEQAAQLCANSMGPVASRLGTAFVADDIDAIRVALGADKINFFGYSYGSTLGTWYASQYPTHVRAMVLDGAPQVVTDNSTQQTRVDGALAQERGFEEQLAEALAACNTADCPIYNDGDPTSAYLEALENKDLATAATGDPATTGDGVNSFLYGEDDWPNLWQAIADLRDGDPTAIVESAKLQHPYDGASFGDVVNCLDSWAIHPSDDRATQLADEQAIDTTFREEFPLLGPVDIISRGACPFFDVLNPPAAPVALNGGDVPILVIGNRSDPATPFAESERLATEVLSNGYLIDTDHSHHTVFPENDCVNDYVYAVLFDEQLPSSQVVTCERQDPEVLPALPPLEQIAADCPAGANEQVPEATAEQVEEICRQIVQAAATRLTADELEALMNGTADEQTFDKATSMFDEIAAAVMES